MITKMRFLLTYDIVQRKIEPEINMFVQRKATIPSKNVVSAACKSCQAFCQLVSASSKEKQHISLLRGILS